MTDVIQIVAGIGGLGLVGVLIAPHWRIFKRLGCHPALSFLVMLPLVNIAVWYYVAYSEKSYPAGTGKALR